MTYITFKQNNGAGIGHNSNYINALFSIIENNKNLKYIHTYFKKKSNYYDKIFQYDNLFQKYDVNVENLNKINVTNENDLNIDDANTLLIINEDAIKNIKIAKKNNDILINKLPDIRNFLKNEIDYDKNSINITMHIRRGDIMNNINTPKENLKSRYLSNEYYVNILNKLRCLNLGKLKINLVSDGKLSGFENDFRNFDINYILGEDAYCQHSGKLKRTTVSYLIFNDIFITAHSGFSYLCCIYSTGLIITNNVRKVLKHNPNNDKILNIDNMNREEILNKMKKNLLIYINKGNIGHSFNDHQYACFSYYLNNIHLIDKIYIILKEKNMASTNINLINDFFNKNCLLEETSRYNINISYSMLFFMFEKKKENIIFVDKITTDIINPVILKPAIFRNVMFSNNFIDVYKKLRDNFKKYLNIKNIKNKRYDITIIYRKYNPDQNPYTRGGRCINNIEKFIEVCNEKKITYKICNTSEYNFETIINLFYSSDNILSFHGCELTFGFAMKKNTTIIELTKKGHLEHWWNAMGRSFSEYGLNYHRLPLELDENDNLNFNDTNISNILKLSSIDKKKYN